MTMCDQLIEDVGILMLFIINFVILSSRDLSE